MHPRIRRIPTKRLQGFPGHSGELEQMRLLSGFLGDSCVLESYIFATQRLFSFKVGVVGFEPTTT